MIDLSAVVQSVCQKATTFRPYEFNLVTIEAAREVARPTIKIRITRHAPVVLYQGHQPDATFTVEVVNTAMLAQTTVNMGWVFSKAATLSKIAFAKTQYGNVASDPLFHLLYDVKDRPLDYIEAGVPVKKTVSSAPCMLCGLVLPLRNLTIDHQRPQTGGEIEAVAKTFRAFGLTNEGPKGPKGRAIMQHLSTGALLQPVHTKPGRVPLAGTSLDARYTLSNEGAVLYSFVADAGKKDVLKDQCMHGLFNLQPACQACNSARGNPLKYP